MQVVFIGDDLAWGIIFRAMYPYVIIPEVKIPLVSTRLTHECATLSQGIILNNVESQQGELLQEILHSKKVECYS